MVILVDNISLLKNSYKENEDIVIPWATEKEIEEAFFQEQYIERNKVK